MITKAYQFICAGLLCCGLAAVTTSCEDFFDQESDQLVFAEDQHLDNAVDTIYSVTGIMRRLQAVAERTILLGEARGDLVDVTNATSSDLRDVANFNIGDDNQYNQPRDYYAVINNCNFFIAHADTALRNSRDQRIFKQEFAVVKAYRAWTYLQLAINYGRVPFITEPVLTKEQADILETGHFMDLQSICDWLIADLTPITTEQYYINNGFMPSYGDIGYRTDSRFFFFPIQLLLGELNLWAGHYREAAQWYYKYITERNGVNNAYPTGLSKVQWMNTSWTGLAQDWIANLVNETYSTQSELITMIPGDSIPYNGNYLQLRNIFNSFNPISGEYHEVSLVPSQQMKNISASQVYCYVTDRDTIYVPEDAGRNELYHGDLRLIGNYTTGYTYHNGDRVSAQIINKYSSRNAHIWRRQMVWLHMAEALNRAGYPRFAYQILARGLSNRVIESEVLPYYTADSTFIRSFDFPNETYVAAAPQGIVRENMQGLHSRGSGWAYLNKYYQMPDDTLIVDSLQRIAWQQDKVEQMIADEGALEFAFEGLRYYDLMRMALHRNEPAFLADRIYARRGKSKTAEMKGDIKKDLYQPSNWYLQWKGKIGY